MVGLLCLKPLYGSWITTEISDFLWRVLVLYQLLASTPRRLDWSTFCYLLIEKVLEIQFYVKARPERQMDPYHWFHSPPYPRALPQTPWKIPPRTILVKRVQTIHLIKKIQKEQGKNISIEIRFNNSWTYPLSYPKSLPLCYNYKNMCLPYEKPIIDFSGSF